MDFENINWTEVIINLVTITAAIMLAAKVGKLSK